MFNAVQKTLMAGTFACALLLPFAAQAQERPLPMPPQVLEITVQEKISAAPELAYINAGVMTTAKTAAEAMQENAKRMNAVFDSLRKAGIKDKDLQTSGIQLNAQYDYSRSSSGDGEPKLTGYQAVNTVNITVRDLASLGKTLDATVAAGVNQINGPTFDVSDREAHLDKARAAAVANASKRADIYAKAANLKLRKIISISEQPMHGGPAPIPMMRAMAMDSAAAAPTPIAPGTLDIGLAALIRFELGE